MFVYFLFLSIIREECISVHVPSECSLVIRL